MNAQTERDLARFRQVRLYTLQHAANHLHAAGHRARLHRLLTVNQAWMIAKAERLQGYRAYRTDLELALDDFSDPVVAEDLVALVELHTADHVVSAQVSEYNDDVLEALVWLGRKEEALAFAEERVDSLNKFKGFLTVQETMQQKGERHPGLLNELIETAAEIPTEEYEEYRVHALRDLATALFQAGDPRALDIFDQGIALASAIEARLPYVQGPMIDGREYAATLIQASRFEEAERIARQSHGNDKKIYVLCKLATALRTANPDKAEDLYDWAQKSAAKERNVQGLLQLAAVLHTQGHPRASQAWQAAVQCAEDRQSVEDWAAIGLYLAEAGDAQAQDFFTKAIAAAASNPERETRATQRLALGQVLAQAGDQRAPTIFDGAVADIRKIEYWPWGGRTGVAAKVVALSHLAAALCAAEDPRAGTFFDEALEAVSSLEDKGDQRSILRDLALALARCGDERALPILLNSQAAPEEPSDEAPPNPANEALKVTLLVHAKQFSQALDRARTIQDLDVRIAALHAIGEAFCLSGDFHPDAIAEELLAAARLAEEPDRASRHYGPSRLNVGRLAAVGVALASLGDQRAQAVFEQALTTAELISGGNLPERVAAFRDLGQARQQVGLGQAADLFEAAIDMVTSYQYGGGAVGYLVSLRRELVATLIQVERLEEARELAMNLGGPGDQGDQARREVAQALASAEDFDLAREVMDRISSREQLDFSQRALGCALVEAGRLDEAAEVARAARGLIRVAVLTRLGTAQARESAEAAEPTFQEAGTAALAMGPGQDRDQALQLLARALAETGRLSSAFAQLRPLSLVDFLGTLTEWSPLIEAQYPGLLSRVLYHATRILCWVRPEWEPIAGAIAPPAIDD